MHLQLKKLAFHKIVAGTFLYLSLCGLGNVANPLSVKTVKSKGSVSQWLKAQRRRWLVSA